MRPFISDKSNLTLTPSQILLECSSSEEGEAITSSLEPSTIQTRMLAVFSGVSDKTKELSSTHYHADLEL